MAIVTRRYLYQGPPLQEVRSKTDPGLTLASASKLTFDVTFDDTVADVAAVDQAMAESGDFVPDPTADTSVPALLNAVAQWFPTPVITAPLTIVEPNAVARCDTIGGPVTIQLPAALGHRGVVNIVKDVGGAALLNAITIAPSGLDTINGNLTATIIINKGALTLLSDGENDWMII